jgi:hypothetical protein
MPIEVNSIAFGMSRYSTRWHLVGVTWTERRAGAAAREGVGRCRGRHQATRRAVFAGVVPPPMAMQTQIERMSGMVA